MDQYPSARAWISWLLQLVATICNLRLAGVEMTCVSARFGEPIKDGLSSQRRTEAEGKTTGARESRRDQGDAQRIEIPDIQTVTSYLPEAHGGG